MNKETARAFVYRNARPLQLALWKYYFEDGDREEILRCMSYYQNPDGGFGHGLEPDNFSPASSPIQTWQATEILWKIGLREKEHPMVKGILQYLDSGAGYSAHTKQWKFCVESTNAYPHAVWWEYREEPKDYYPNPTPSLAGFILYFAQKGSPLYQKGLAHVKAAYEYLETHFPDIDAPTATCYIQMYHYCVEAGETELFDMLYFKEMLTASVNRNICHDSEKWGVEYVPTPMKYMESPDSMFYQGNEALVQEELARLERQQSEDGSFPVPWIWYNEYREFVLAENWWKSVMIIENMLFCEAFSDASGV